MRTRAHTHTHTHTPPPIRSESSSPNNIVFQYSLVSYLQTWCHNQDPSSRSSRWCPCPFLLKVMVIPSEHLTTELMGTFNYHQHVLWILDAHRVATAPLGGCLWEMQNLRPPHLSRLAWSLSVMYAHCHLRSTAVPNTDGKEKEIHEKCVLMVIVAV